MQFSYRTNMSVDNIVNLGLHFILQHLGCCGSYTRLLFFDYSSAFNTIVPELLLTKISQLTVFESLLITDLLTDREQCVRLVKPISSHCRHKIGVLVPAAGPFSVKHASTTGAPQDCLLSPLLYLHKLLTFTDDTTVFCLFQDGDESVYRQQ